MTTIVVIVLVALLLFAALRLWITANRLDRLHVRTEAAWSALEGALARRVVATRAVAAAGGLDHQHSEHLRRLADIADRADRAHRADAENDLSRALSTVPPAAEPDLAAELADASERVVLARRFYNDAVRDTRALRAVLFTRIFGLAGRAAMPDYFEIAEYPRSATAPLRRTAARVVLLRRRRPGAAALRHRPAGGFPLVDHPGWWGGDRRGTGRHRTVANSPKRPDCGSQPISWSVRSGTGRRSSPSPASTTCRPSTTSSPAHRRGRRRPIRHRCRRTGPETSRPDPAAPGRPDGVTAADR